MSNIAVALILDRSNRCLLVERGGTLAGIGVGVSDGIDAIAQLGAEIEAVTGIHAGRDDFYPLVEMSHSEGVAMFYLVTLPAEALNQAVAVGPSEHNVVGLSISTVVRYQRVQNLDWLLALAQFTVEGPDRYDTVLVSAR